MPPKDKEKREKRKEVSNVCEKDKMERENDTQKGA